MASHRIHNTLKVTTELHAAWKIHAELIERRLSEFRAEKTPQDYFYELCYCLCTPQTKAAYALRAIDVLRSYQFFERGFNPTSILCNRECYIRFHNTKAARLVALREHFDVVYEQLTSDLESPVLRLWLTRHVNGLGMKEASHVLRNCGRFDVVILDRHIMRALTRFGILHKPRMPTSIKQYTVIERLYQNFAKQCGYRPEQLDLLLWVIETGEVLK